MLFGLVYLPLITSRVTTRQFTILLKIFWPYLFRMKQRSFFNIYTCHGVVLVIPSPLSLYNPKFLPCFCNVMEKEPTSSQASSKLPIYIVTDAVKQYILGFFLKDQSNCQLNRHVYIRPFAF